MNPSYTIVTPYSEMAAYIDQTDMKYLFSEWVLAMRLSKKGKKSRIFWYPTPKNPGLAGSPECFGLIRATLLAARATPLADFAVTGDQITKAL